MSTSIYNTIESTPLHALFVFFLIISANFLGQLYPCKIQRVFSDNVYLKHFLGLLTLVFFVVLIDTSTHKTLETTIITSIGLYILFLILMNTNVLFFLISIIALAILYLFHLKENETQKSTNDTIYNAKIWKPILYSVFGISTLLGFVIYMGEKKIEYGKQFDYTTFVFGKPSCRHKSPSTKLWQSFQAAFS
jgi:hypothetical protein